MNTEEAYVSIALIGGIEFHYFCGITFSTFMHAVARRREPFGETGTADFK